MDVKWETPLKEWQRSNPVVYAARLDLDALGVAMPTEEDLLKMFPTKSYRLQTWNRSKDGNGKTILVDDPHWLAVRRGTPLHTDPKYPRYSYQLKVRVDSGIFVRGHDKEEMQLHRGTFYVLDTHSPHQVFHKDAEGAWNVTASIDHTDLLEFKPMMMRLIQYAKKTHITEGMKL